MVPITIILIISISLIIYYRKRVTIKGLMFDYLRDSFTVDEKYDYEFILSGGNFLGSFRKLLPLGNFDILYHIENDTYNITIKDKNNELFRVQRGYLESFMIGKLTKKEVKNLLQKQMIKIV